MLLLNEYNGQGIIDDNGTPNSKNSQSKLTTVSINYNNNWINNDNYSYYVDQQ